MGETAGRRDLETTVPAGSLGAPPNHGLVAAEPRVGEYFAWVIVELAPDAILVVDEHGRILMANRAAETMFGYDRETLLRIGVEGLIPENRRQGHRGHRAAFNASPELRPMGLGLDLWGRRADGSEFPVEISLSPVTETEGTRVVAVVREVTAHRAVEQAVRDRRVLADHDRIATDLHHRVIGHLFASAMNIEAVVGRVDPYVAERLASVTGELDLAIREISETVFASTPHAGRHPGSTDPGKTTTPREPAPRSP